MLGHIYYAIGLITVLIVLSMLMRFKKINSIREWFDKYKAVTGKAPEKKDFRSKEENDLYTGISVLAAFEFVWALGGLLTGSWYVFLSLIVYSIVLGFLIKPIRYSIIGRITALHFLILKFSVYLFLVINHFHLHYDILSIVKQMIQ